MKIKSKKLIELIIGLGMFSNHAQVVAANTDKLSLVYPASYSLTPEDCEVIEEQLDGIGNLRNTLAIYRMEEDNVFSASMLNGTRVALKFKSLRAEFDWAHGSLVSDAIKVNIESGLKRDIKDSVLNHPEQLRLKVNSRLLLCDIIGSKLKITIRMSGNHRELEQGPIKISKNSLLGLSKGVASYKEKIKTMGLEYSAKNYENRDLVAGAILGLELFKVSKQSIHNLEGSDLHYLKSQFFDEFNFQPKSINDLNASQMEQDLRVEKVIIKEFEEVFTFQGGK